MKKIIRPEGPAKKVILLRFSPKKISRPGPKFQAQPPPPKYQTDRALHVYVYLTRNSFRMIQQQ